MYNSDSLKNLTEALFNAFHEFTSVPMNAKNPHFNAKYADLGSVISTTKPVLKKHGLFIIQMPVSSQDGKIGVTTRLVHSSGEWIQETITVDLVPTGHRSLAQDAGAVITYLRRYAWSAMLGLYSEEDVDANIYTPKASKSPEEELGDAVAHVTSAGIVDACVREGIFENKQSAVSVLSRFVPKKDTEANIFAKAQLYRDWRNNGAEPDYALEKANAGKEVE